MSIARLLYSLFFSDSTHFALGGIQSNGDVKYITTEGLPTLAMIEQHIAGEIVLGAYTVIPGNTVRWMAFDVDSKKDPEKARELTSKISSFLEKIPHIVEWSGNKGYHLILLFRENVAAKEAKRIGDSIRDLLGISKSGDPHVEVFPKQDELTDSNPRGSLLRLPMGVHPKTRNETKFIDPKNDWAEVTPEEALSRFADIRQLARLVDTSDPVEQLKGLFAPYWLPGQRHDMALWTAGYLATMSWTEESVRELIDAIYEEVGEGDTHDWQRGIKDTFAKVYNGETIIGFQGLARVIPQEVLQKIQNIASNQTFSSTLKNIDMIRLGKGTTWQKVRLAAKAIVSFLKENGRLVRDSNNTYWLDNKSRKLLMLAGADWERHTHNEFGLNNVESFGRQTAESIKQYAYEQAEVVQVYKRSYWDGEKLLINLGSSEVYVLHGDPAKRQTLLNGEGGVLFLNSEDPMEIENLAESDCKPMDPWAFLVDDVNFAEGDKVDASTEQQRQLFKAWIVSICFSTMLPTRPILTLLATSGAGKTTTARRILRFFEGPHEEVLGIVSDKPDSFRASLTAHKVLVLDNLEKTKATWLTDSLNRISTGSHIEVRRLHTTNEMYRIKPDCNTIITATDVPFSDETVFTRMLPIQLAPPTSRRAEYQIQVELLDNLHAMWKGMLDDLDKVVAELKTNKSVVMPSESRLADFTVFCSRIQNADFLDGKELMAGLANLVNRQKNVLSQHSPFMAVIEIIIRTRPDDLSKWLNISELYGMSQRVAHANRIEWDFSSAQGLSRHVGMLEPKLIQWYGMEVKNIKQGGREVRVYRFEKEKRLMN